MVRKPAVSSLVVFLFILFAIVLAALAQSANTPATHQSAQVSQQPGLVSPLPFAPQGINQPIRPGMPFNPLQALATGRQGLRSDALRNSVSANSIFLEAAPYASGGAYAESVVMADVNRDGNADLLVVNQCASTSNCNNGEVGVLLGNGDGTFQPAVTYGSGGQTSLSLAVADVNGDGALDLLVTNECVSGSKCASGGQVGVLLGNGDGTFQAVVTYGSGGGNATSAAVADVNGDGNTDLLVVNQCASISNCSSGGEIAVLLGNGDGTFRAAVTYASGGFDSSSIAVADVNGDGALDVMVGNQCASSSTCSNGGAVSVLLGNGDGTFLTPVSYVSGGGDAVSVAVVDVNGDGTPDLLVVNSCTSNTDCSNGGIVGVLLGNGNGTFQAAAGYGSGGVYARSGAVADVNGDGKLDLLVANDCAIANCTSDGEVGVLLGNGDGTFQSAVSYGSNGSGTFSIAVGDVNGDGKLDLLVANVCGSGSSTYSCNDVGTVSVLLGSGNGSFQAAESYPSGGIQSYSMAVADVNGDGTPDLVVSNECASITNCSRGAEVSVLLGNGDGSFQAPVSYDPGGDGPSSIALADVNGDGNPDLLVANQCASNITCGNGGEISVLLGNGDGTFKPAISYGSGGYTADWLAVADLNGDGNPDLLVANYCDTFLCKEGGVVGVLLGNGDGTFQPAVSYASGGLDAYSVAVADVNGDGTPDLLVATFCVISNCNNGEIGVLLGNGDGTFRAAVSYGSGGYGALSVAVADINGDGKPDLLVVNDCATNNTCKSGAGEFSLLLGNGDGAFRAALTTAISSSLTGGQIAVADFNGDGNLDVAIGSGSALLLGNGDGTFQAPLNLGAGGGSASAVGDFNGDGSPDLAVGNVTILLNISSPAVQPTTTVVTSSQSSSNYGQPVTFTATVTSGGAPKVGAHGMVKGGVRKNGAKRQDVSGTVTWSSNTGCGTTTVTTGNPGVATCTTSTLPVGTDTVTGSYSGDSSNSASSGSFSQTVNQANSSVSVSSTLNPSTYGQALSFTATVTGATPTGTVQFNVDGSPFGSPVTLAGGSATSSSTSTLAVGTHTVTATYSGDSNNAGSTGTLASGQVVNSAGALINITSSLNPTVYGQSVTFTATISGANGLLKRNAVKSQDVTGSVTWSDLNGPIICAESGTSTTPITTGNPGTTTCTTSALAANAGDLITGAYSGDSNHDPGTGSTQQTITQATSNTAVASSGSPTTYGQSVTFTATISGQYGPLTRKNGVKSQDVTGTVAWSANTGCGTTNVTSGIAACVTTSLGAGTDSISTTYSGDTNHSGSAGAATQVVNVATQTITFSVNAPASAAYNSQFTVAATGGGSGNPVVFISAGSCSNVGATYTMTAGTGTCSVIANQSGNGNYSAAPTVTQNVNAALAVPTVSFTGAPASAPYLSTFTVAATTNAGVAATIKAIGSCTVSSTTVTIIKGTGTCTMTASWPATSNYTSATAKQTTLAVKATPVVTWTAPAPITYGTPLSATQLDATANVTGTFFYTPPAGKVLKAGTQTLSVKFTPTQSTNYNTVTATVQITVNKVGTTTTITSNTPNPSTTGQLVLVNYSVAQAITNPTKPTGKVTVTASTGESCSASLLSGSGHCSIKFTTSGSRTLTATYPGDTNNNSSVSAGVTQTVN